MRRRLLIKRRSRRRRMRERMVLKRQEPQPDSSSSSKPCLISAGLTGKMRNDMRRLQIILAILLVLAIAPVALQAQLTTKRVLTLNLAKKIAAVAETEALRRGATVVIAVVDDGGYLLVLERLDDTQVASVDV